MAAENVVMTQVTLSAVTVAVINWLKASPYFPWITKEKVALVRVLSVLGAALTSVGIAWVWDPAAHSLTITGLSLAAIGAFGYAALKSFVMNEVLYNATRKPSAAAPANVYTPRKP